MSDLVNKYGITEAKKLWEFTNSGVTNIHENIKEFNLDCDYQLLDTFVVADSNRKFKSVVQIEYDARAQAGYPSSLYVKEQMGQVRGSSAFYGGISYGGTFGIHGYRYCQSMKEALKEQGIQIYEETPAVDIQDHQAELPRVQSKQSMLLFVWIGTYGRLPSVWDKVYRVQTFIMLSAPLSERQALQIFPQNRYLVWDTDLVYQYFRLTGDNRLILGGASILNTYFGSESHNNNRVIRKLQNYFAHKFPQLDSI